MQCDKHAATAFSPSSVSILSMMDSSAWYPWPLPAQIPGPRGSIFSAVWTQWATALQLLGASLNVAHAHVSATSACVSAVGSLGRQTFPLLLSPHGSTFLKLSPPSIHFFFVFGGSEQALLKIQQFPPLVLLPAMNDAYKHSLNDMQ